MGMNEMAFGNGEPGIAGRRTERWYAWGTSTREDVFFGILFKTDSKRSLMNR